MLPRYIIAVDLGQVNDYSAIAVLARTEQPTGRQDIVPNLASWFDGGKDQPRYVRRPQLAGHYDVVFLERLALGTPYTDIPGRLQTIEAGIGQQWVEHAWHALQDEAAALGLHRQRDSGPTLADAPVEVVVDGTGVGRPVMDLLREAGIDAVAITIHGGDRVIRVHDREFRTPKRDLVGAVQSALQSRRLRAAAALPLWPTLKAELGNFKARISLNGHDSYGAGSDWRQNNHDDLVLALALGVWWGETVWAAPVTGRMSSVENRRI